VQVRRRPALARLAALAQRYRIEVDLAARVDTLSVGAQQRVEILKALIGGARALILDEPTAVLAPQETAALFTTLRELAARGWGIFIVTHKLTDAMQLTDRVTVMRQGRRVGTWPTAAISAEALVSHMIAGTAADGAEAASMPAAQAPAAAVRGEAVLELREVRCVGSHGRPGLRGLTLTVHAGEIVGVAGIEGNGQRELAEIITGLRRIVAGSASYGGTPISRQSTAALLRNGIAHVPEDRHRDGVVLDFSIAENAALVAHAAPPLRRRGLLDHGRARGFAERLIRDYDIRCTGPRAKLRSLSGGNQQKLVLGRELARVPRLLVAAQPTRGLDVGAIDYVHRRLLNGRAAGMAVLLISAELDEILALSDRIAVLREGRIVGVLDRAAADAEAVGRLMLAPTAAAA
jgi:simple sugar transport system ATP-binding protein